MPRLDFDVSEELANIIRRQARVNDKSVSQYLAELVESALSSEWPGNYFEEIVGRWKGEPLQRPPQGEFEERA